jgi:signal transduction histidine kinase
LVHDLREPLRSINVFAELLQESPADPDMAHHLAEIRNSATRMQTLLQGLSGYSMALHETRASAASVSLQSALKIVLSNMDADIRANKAVVNIGDLPRVSLSLERAMQLFEQLIGNSLRFRSEDAPAVRVWSEEVDGGMAAIHIEDNGIGIPEEYRDTVFEPFFRVEGKKYPGVGMGLAICRKVVEAHGGTISMRAGANRGAVCTFTLPEA